MFSWIFALASVSNWRARNQSLASANSLVFTYMPYPFAARGVNTTLAPRKRIRRLRSMEKLSAIVTTRG